MQAILNFETWIVACDISIKAWGIWHFIFAWKYPIQFILKRDCRKACEMGKLSKILLNSIFLNSAYANSFSVTDCSIDVSTVPGRDPRTIRLEGRSVGVREIWNRVTENSNQSQFWLYQSSLIACWSFGGFYGQKTLWPTAYRSVRYFQNSFDPGPVRIWPSDPKFSNFTMNDRLRSEDPCFFGLFLSQWELRELCLWKSMKIISSTILRMMVHTVGMQETRSIRKQSLQTIWIFPLMTMVSSRKKYSPVIETMNLWENPNMFSDIILSHTIDTTPALLTIGSSTIRLLKQIFIYFPVQGGLINFLYF